MPPQGGDPPCVTLQSGPSELQSTPPHGRRRPPRVLRQGYNEVSIHASAREATHTFLRPRTSSSVSIHASAREATHDCSDLSIWVAVSIHASAREATDHAWAWATSGMPLFQSTPPHGRRRHNHDDARGVYDGFNPRLRTGGDSPTCRRYSSRIGRFNPRLRTGGDYCGE